MTHEIAAFVARRWAVSEDLLTVEVQPLGGGLESRVTRATLAGKGPAGVLPHRLVVKRLTGDAGREAAIYQLLWRHLDDPPAARLWGVQSAGSDQYLYLEDVHAASAWPWSDVRLAGAVCRALARFHDQAVLPREAFEWDYESHLAQSADATLEVAARALYRDGTRCWRRMGDLRRVVAALPAMRAQLLDAGRTIIHGDVHPGNVLVRRDGVEPHVTMIDWSRARVGSPLEDVGSWLHSLGCWEPQARRRHDTLLRTYGQALDRPLAVTREVRALYTLACVSNGLSGAIRYQLAVLAAHESSDVDRGNAWLAVRAWERVVRRAAALLNTSADRSTTERPREPSRSTAPPSP